MFFFYVSSLEYHIFTVHSNCYISISKLVSVSAQAPSTATLATFLFENFPGISPFLFEFPPSPARSLFTHSRSLILQSFFVLYKIIFPFVSHLYLPLQSFHFPTTHVAFLVQTLLHSFHRSFPIMWSLLLTLSDSRLSFSKFPSPFQFHILSIFGRPLIRAKQLRPACSSFSFHASFIHILLVVSLSACRLLQFPWSFHFHKFRRLSVFINTLALQSFRYPSGFACTPFPHTRELHQSVPFKLVLSFKFYSSSSRLPLSLATLLLSETSSCRTPLLSFPFSSSPAAFLLHPRWPWPP